MMVKSAEFIKAAEALKHMPNRELAAAGMACEILKMSAVRRSEKKIAVEMTAMFGEVTQEMVRRMARDGKPLPEGLTLEASLAKVEAETNKEIAELEAA